MQVRALRAGFYGGDLKPAGAIFTVAENHHASWFAPIPEQEAKQSTQMEPPNLGKPRRGRPPSSGSRATISPDASESEVADPALP